MEERVFRVLVIVLLLAILISQVPPAIESAMRLFARAETSAKVAVLQAQAKKEIFDNPDVKGIYQQIFLQEQINGEYLAMIAQR